MIQKHSENVGSNFDGTIIDIETIGSFERNYNDSRYYQNIIPVIFGFIDKKHAVRVLSMKWVDYDVKWKIINQ